MKITANKTKKVHDHNTEPNRAELKPIIYWLAFSWSVAFFSLFFGVVHGFNVRNDNYALNVWRVLSVFIVHLSIYYDLVLKISIFVAI